MASMKPWRAHYIWILSAGILALPALAWAAITATTTQDLSFGLVQKPTATRFITVTQTGTLGTTNIIRLGGVIANNVVTLRSNTTQRITVDIQNISAPAGITLNTWRVRYRNRNYTTLPIANLANPGAAGTPIYIGARANITRNVPSGPPPIITYDLVVTEQ